MSSKRRTSYEIVYEILNYLKKANRSVKLNDIALGIGTNTRIIQRWLKIIRDIQAAPQISFADIKGSRIQLKDPHQVEIQSGIFIQSSENSFEITKLFNSWLQDPIKSDQKLFSGNWTISVIFDQSKLVVIEKSQVLYDNIDNLLSKPFIMIESNSLPLQPKDAFFYLRGFYETEIDNNNSIQDLPIEIAGILSNHLIYDIFREEEIAYLSIILELIVPSSGQIPEIFQLHNLDDYFQYITIIAKIFNNYFHTGKTVLRKAKIWTILKNREINNIQQSEFGRLFLAKINYCILKPVSHQISKENFSETDYWNLLGLLEMKKIAKSSQYIDYCISYLNDRTDELSIILLDYLSHIIQIQEVQVDKREVDDFYAIIEKISPMLRNLANPKRWNWFELGSLFSVYHQLSDERHTYLKILVLRKLEKYSKKNTLSIPLKYLLLASSNNYSCLNLLSIHYDELITWTFFNSTLTQTNEIINIYFQSNIKYLQGKTILKTLIMKLFMFDLIYLENALIDDQIKNKINSNHLLLELLLLLLVIMNPSNKKFPNINYFIKNQSLVSQYNKLLSDVIDISRNNQYSFENEFYTILSTLYLEFSNVRNYDIQQLRALIDKTEINDDIDRSIVLLLKLKLSTKLETEYFPDYRIVLKKIGNHDMIMRNTNLQAMVVGTAYLLSQSRSSSSSLRNNLRSQRRNLSDKLVNIHLLDNYAFAKLYLQIIDNIDDIMTEKILHQTFPDYQIDIDVFSALELLLIRYYFRKNYYEELFK